MKTIGVRLSTKPSGDSRRGSTVFSRVAKFPRIARGFTLVEVAIVLAVIGVLVVAVLPSAMNQARTELAERAVKEIIRIQDASKAFYLNSAPAGTPSVAVWPGQGLPCGTNPNATRNALLGVAPVAAPYVVAAELLNPWGNPYIVETDSAPTADQCGIRVKTQVPLQLAGLIRTFLPQATCGANVCGLAAGAGNQVCCSSISKPGMERVLGRFEPKMSRTLCEEALAGTYVYTPALGPRCQFPTGTRDAASCFWRGGPGICPLGYRVAGATCGKNCGGSSNVYCCKTRNPN